MGGFNRTFDVIYRLKSVGALEIEESMAILACLYTYFICYKDMLGNQGVSALIFGSKGVNSGNEWLPLEYHVRMWVGYGSGSYQVWE